MDSDARRKPGMAGCSELDVETFESLFLKRGYFLGENKLDRVLLSLLHLKDVCLQEEYLGVTYLINRDHFGKKTRQESKLVAYRYKIESRDEGFSFVRFAFRYGVPLDTINGVFPLAFEKPRLVFHSLKLSYALYLTLKMFRLKNLKCNQRVRSNLMLPLPDNLLSAIFLQIYSELKKKNLSESQLIKCIKNSLCLMVSKSLEQNELPEGDSIVLFPPDIWKEIRTFLSPEGLVRFCFSCLQSKVLCEEVPEEFILDTLIKHRDQLSSPHRGLTPEIIKKLQERGREFGKKVKKFYRFDRGFFPTNKATFAFPRNRGGVKGDLVYNDCLVDLPQGEDPDDRIEPFVIGLFGQPGQGKSVLISRIVASLGALFPGVKGKDLVYQRTCHVDHWDGYCGQPITIFDDLGQAQDGSDIKEFQTLVSCCPYVLPMAELSEKGMKFSSSFIITTSNMKYNQNLNQVYKKTGSPIIDDVSFWRRFHYPVIIEKDQAFTLRVPPDFSRPGGILSDPDVGWRDIAVSDGGYLSTPTVMDERLKRKSFSENFIPIDFRDSEELLSIYYRRRLFHENIRKNWLQKTVNGEEKGESLIPLLKHSGIPESILHGLKQGGTSRKGLTFPAFPPSGPLPVRVVPIVEPLKVRTITAGIGETFCLKPLQRAMWEAMGLEPQFVLTHGTNNLNTAVKQLYESSVPGSVWISGDYSAATDSFAIEASKALLQGILESIDHEPTKRWAMKEISPHLLVYPGSSGLTPVLQESGQLMGSLLSFPLLCLLNDCTAQFSGLKPDQYLINGDDILIRAPKKFYPIWKERVQEFGLELSLGKNYVHPRFGTVNSQLILDGEVVSSGKQRVLDRRSEVLGECLRDLEVHMLSTPSSEVQDLFKSVNRMKLSRTIRDISVPVSHGGLSFSWGPEALTKKSKRTQILCYLHDLFKKMKPLSDCISIPYLSTKEKIITEICEQEQAFNEVVDSKVYHEDFLTVKDISLVQKRCMTHSNLRRLLLDQDIRTLPSLSFIHTYQIPCRDHKVRKDLQKEIDSMFLERFLQGGDGFGYESFREDFLKKMSNLPSTEVTVRHVVELMDLNIKEDFLQFVNLDFVSKPFDPELFKKGLGGALAPKEFDLPEFTDFVDFSEEVIQSFNELLASPQSEEQTLMEKDWFSRPKTRKTRLVKIKNSNQKEIELIACHNKQSSGQKEP
ncbi:RNA-dependent RNA polymerase [Hubei narna-like virus 12]|uniref:RNA-dependent RNA polymerase n=1 Tax=Hubei narna-like virus 12 TaxID=1922942 RepID=UPI00090BE93B|nr:RNA-dependent RNA polymerase [Hubei narna-like virus 12]APG77197.1 RNA-dependent RNA polymerase [Hubei narna-like virus 12]